MRSTLGCALFAQIAACAWNQNAKMHVYTCFRGNSCNLKEQHQTANSFSSSAAYSWNKHLDNLELCFEKASQRHIVCLATYGNLSLSIRNWYLASARSHFQTQEIQTLNETKKKGGKTGQHMQLQRRETIPKCNLRSPPQNKHAHFLDPRES